MFRFVRRLPLPLVAVFISIIVAPGATHAHVTGCRTDPLVTLTNLTQITLNEQIGDASTDVTGINYVLHVPKGVRVLTVIYYGAVPARLQTLTTVSDEPPGVYDDYTTVYTATSPVTVTAYLSTDVLFGTYASGYNGQALHSHMQFL